RGDTIIAAELAADIEEPGVALGGEPQGGFREVLAIPAFRRLWLAQLCAQFGEAIALVAMPLLAYALTGSAELLSLIFILQLLPRIVLAPLTGLLADRLDRRRLLIAADVGRAAVVIFLPFAGAAWQVAVLATLVAVGNALARPAELAAVPAVVPANQLVPALSASQVATSIVRVIGPALAGGIIALTGPGPAFAAQAACFLVSAGILLGLVLPPVARTPITGGAMAAVRQEMADGLRIVWQNRIVRGTAAVESLWQSVFAALVVTTLIYVEQSLRMGEASASVYSLLTATFAGGTALGALAARPVERRIGRPRLMAIGYLAPLMLIPALFTPPLPVLFACWLFLGFADAWAVIAMQSYLAEAVPDAMRGRTYATWTGVVTLAGAIAFGVIGWATPRLGPPLTLALTGAIVGVGGPLILIGTGALAAMRDERVRREGRVAA
ncbi:MAG TPA: MFS transporter, partial [Vicinamibacteria bacterium]|nr:MFS transporter [Vicinamibacteria bacterium]